MDDSLNRYSTPFDRFYQTSEAASVEVMLDRPIESSGATVREVGTTSNPFEHQTKALLARIREGASRVEFEFMGTGKGNKQAFTPETFGSEERREMRELARLNEIETSTHASPNMGPMSGFGQQGFSDEARENVIKELKKAIDFAAEASTGGAVVLHISEWQRPIEEYYGDQFRQFETDRIKDTVSGDMVTPDEATRLNKEDIGPGKRYKYISEADKAPLYLANEKTGQVQALRRDMDFFVPVLDDAMTEESNKHGGPPIFQVIEEGTRKGEVKIEKKTFDQVLTDFRERAENGRKTRNMEEYYLGYNDDGTKKTDVEVVYQAYLNKEIAQAEGDALRWAMRVPDYKKQYQQMDQLASEQADTFNDQQRRIRNELQENNVRLNERLRQLANDDSDPARQEKDALQQQIAQNNDMLQEDSLKETAYSNVSRTYRGNMFIDRDGVPNHDAIEKEKKEIIAQIHSDQSTGSGQMQRAKQLKEELKYTKKIEDVGLSKAADTIAKAGVYMLEQYNKHKDELKTPLYISPESYAPEQYGGHPDEIRKIIDASRKRMAELLSNKYSKEEAKKLSEQHIKATLDAGHINIWRKYLVRKEGESLDTYEKRFNNWLLDKTEELAKDGYVGHVHLSDNFGYDDEHLIPGEGNVPYTEFIKRMRKHGMREFIQEPGSFNYDYSLRQTWRNMGVSNLGAAYRGAGGVTRALPGRVDEFLHSYFGHTAKPSYVFGKYIPQVPNIEKSWAPWTGTPL